MKHFVILIAISIGMVTSEANLARWMFPMQFPDIDPCDQAFEIPSDDRFPSIDAVSSTKDDSNFVVRWYSFKATNPERYVALHTDCLKPQVCGSQISFRVDLNDQPYPDSGKQINVSICGALNVMGSMDCCVLRQPASIHNCSNHLVYRLLSADRPGGGYCVKEQEDSNVDTQFYTRYGSKWNETNDAPIDYYKTHMRPSYHLYKRTSDSMHLIELTTTEDVTTSSSLTSDYSTFQEKDTSTTDAIPTDDSLVQNVTSIHTEDTTWPTEPGSYDIVMSTDSQEINNVTVLINLNITNTEEGYTTPMTNATLSPMTNATLSPMTNATSDEESSLPHESSTTDNSTQTGVTSISSTSPTIVMKPYMTSTLRTSTSPTANSTPIIQSVDTEGRVVLEFECSKENAVDLLKNVRMGMQHVILSYHQWDMKVVTVTDLFVNIIHMTSEDSDSKQQLILKVTYTDTNKHKITVKADAILKMLSNATINKDFVNFVDMPLKDFYKYSANNLQSSTKNTQTYKPNFFYQQLPLFIAIIVMALVCLLILVFALVYLKRYRRNISWNTAKDMERAKLKEVGERSGNENPITDSEITRDEQTVSETTLGLNGSSHLQPQDDEKGWIVPIEQAPDSFLALALQSADTKL